MIFSIRFRIGKRLGAASRYTLREFCVCVVDRYSLTENEVEDIVTMQPTNVYTCDVLEAKRIK